MMASIREIMTYCNGREIYFYFNMDDGQIYSRESMKSELGFEDILLNDTIDLHYTYRFIPIFQVCEDDEIEQFLLQWENNKKITKLIQTGDKNEINRLFQNLCDYDYGFGSRWQKYIEHVKMEKAVQWCKENHIQYELDV